MEFVIGCPPPERGVWRYSASASSTSQRGSVPWRAWRSDRVGRRHTVTAITKQMGVYTDTVGKWRGRYAPHGLEGLNDVPRNSRPRSTAPASTITVRWSLAEDPIKPWQHRSWISVQDPDFALKAARVLDLYAGFWQGEPWNEKKFAVTIGGSDVLSFERCVPYRMFLGASLMGGRAAGRVWRPELAGMGLSETRR
jgi:hypothetical protein